MFEQDDSRNSQKQNACFLQKFYGTVGIHFWFNRETHFTTYIFTNDQEKECNIFWKTILVSF